MKTFHFLPVLMLAAVTTSVGYAKTEKLDNVTRAIYAAIDANNAVALRKLLATDYRFANPFTPQPLNADGLIGFADATAKGFTGGKHQIKQIIVSENRTTVIGTFVGKHTGLFNGIPATGKDVMMDFISVIEFNKKGMATMQSTQANALALLIQLGAVPPPNPNSNIPNVMNIYGLFGKGDIPGLIGNLADNVEWDSHLNPLFPSARVYQGQKDVYNFFGSLRESAEITAFIPNHFYEKDNTVYVLGTFDYTRLSDGKKLHVNWTMSFAFQDGKVTRFSETFEQPTALMK